MNKKKNIIIGLVIIAWVLIIIVGFSAFQKKKNVKEYRHLLNKAQTYMVNEEFDKAEDTYLEAIQKDPKDYNAYVELSKLYDSQNETQGSRKILKDAVKTVKKTEQKKIYKELSTIDYKELTKESEEEHGTIDYDKEAGMTGVCFLKEVDFNHDGINEFVLVYQNSDTQSYTYEVWGYRGTDIDKLGTGELYGTDGGVKNLILIERDEQFYLVTGTHDDEAHREYWGYEDGEFKVVRTSEKETSSDGEWICRIDGKEVDRDEWEAEEEKWFQWKENETVFAFMKGQENQVLYDVVKATKKDLRFAIEEVKKEEKEVEQKVENRRITEEEALQLLENEIPVETWETDPEEVMGYIHAEYKITGKENYNNEMCYVIICEVQSDIPGIVHMIWYVSENGTTIYEKCTYPGNENERVIDIRGRINSL